MASELIELLEGLDGDGYDLTIDVHLPSAAQDHLARAEVLREEASRKQAPASRCVNPSASRSRTAARDSAAASAIPDDS